MYALARFDDKPICDLLLRTTFEYLFDNRHARERKLSRGIDHQNVLAEKALTTLAVNSLLCVRTHVLFQELDELLHLLVITESSMAVFDHLLDVG